MNASRIQQDHSSAIMRYKSPLQQNYCVMTRVSSAWESDENLSASLHLFAPTNFALYFLVHASGTSVGALVAAAFAINQQLRFLFSIGYPLVVGDIADVFFAVMTTLVECCRHKRGLSSYGIFAGNGDEDLRA